MPDNEFTEALDNAWRPFRAAVDSLGPHDFERPTSSGWTVKETLSQDERFRGCFYGDEPTYYAAHLSELEDLR